MISSIEDIEKLRYYYAGIGFETMAQTFGDIIDFCNNQEECYRKQIEALKKNGDSK